MKSLIYILIFSFSLIALALCDETKDLRDKCWEQNLEINYEACFEKIDRKKSNELREAFNHTVRSHPNEESMKPIVQQVCELGQNEVLPCFDDSVNATYPECIKLPFVIDSLIHITLFRKLINYFCSDNGKRLIEIAENNGYSCIIDRERYDECYKIMGNEKITNMESPEFQMNPNFCGAYDKMKDCIIEKSSDCSNPKLAVMAGEILPIAREAFPCEG